eukprot:9480602-Pyramimonas_sp.AAC.1
MGGLGEGGVRGPAPIGKTMNNKNEQIATEGVWQFSASGGPRWASGMSNGSPGREREARPWGEG